MIGRFTLVVCACLIGFGCDKPSDLDTAAADPVGASSTQRPTPPRPIPPRPTPRPLAATDDAEQGAPQDVQPVLDDETDDAAGNAPLSADEHFEARRQRRDTGRYSSNYVRTVVSAYTGFGIQDRVALDQVKKALIAYDLTTGHKPRTHEEAMKAIKDCRLPELDEGCRYVYDPDRGEFMVEHPE